MERLTDALTVLRAVEWIEFDDGEAACPLCLRSQAEGHCECCRLGCVLDDSRYRTSSDLA